MSGRIFQAQVNNDGVLVHKDLKAHRDYLAKYYAGKWVNIEYKLPIRAKTHRQLRTWFGLFAEIVLATFDDQGIDTSYFLKLEKPSGVKIDKNFLKAIMYGLCPVFDDNGKIVTMSDMNSEQMSRFFNDCRNTAASNWGINSPEPETNCKVNMP